LLIDQEISGPYDDEQTARDVLGKLMKKSQKSEQLSVDIYSQNMLLHRQSFFPSQVRNKA